jgi:hypothetical protein
MGNDLESILRYLKEQYPDANPASEEDMRLVFFEMLREISDCYESTFGRMQGLIAALDRIDKNLKENLRILKPRVRR